MCCCHVFCCVYVSRISLNRYLYVVRFTIDVLILEVPLTFLCGVSSAGGDRALLAAGCLARRGHAEHAKCLVYNLI